MYGLEIKEHRKIRGITQQNLSKETGIPQNTISWIESNCGIPNIEQCIKLADYYGISLDELVGREFGHTVEHTAKAIQVNNGGNNTQNNYF